MTLDVLYTGLPEGVELNPLQELIVPYIETDDNLVVLAPTASGKTVVAHMLGYPQLRAARRVIYVGIMKALAEEKREDWADPAHPWSDRESVSITGDYRRTAELQDRIDKAQLVTITPESLLSRLRQKDKNAWMGEAGLIVVDEIHLVGGGERGANFEAALLEFTAAYPKCRVLGLSATIPNGHQFRKWIEKMTGRTTSLVRSEYRSVPVVRHFIPYDQGYSAEESERNRLTDVKDLVLTRDDEQFLVFVWKKTFGREIVRELQALGISAEFHSADADLATRKAIEGAFKRRALRVVVSTTTLATGVNLPARNVVATAVEAGGKDIPAYEVNQAIGRAGRPRYDKQGDQWIMVPKKRAERHQERIEKGEPIKSQMIHPGFVAGHFLGAVYIGRIKCAEDFHTWFSRTLAAQQFRISEEERGELAGEIMDDLVKRKMLIEDAEGDIQLTARGRIAAQLMLDPYHFADALRNIHTYLALAAPTDMDVARAIGSCSGYYADYATAFESRAIPHSVKTTCAEPYWKACAVVYARLQGDKVPTALSSLNWQVYQDVDRLSEGVSRANVESERWGADEDDLRRLFYRVKMQCSDREARMRLSDFRPGEARALMRLGIYTIEEARQHPTISAEVLNPRRLAVLRIKNVS